MINSRAARLFIPSAACAEHARYAPIISDLCVNRARCMRGACVELARSMRNSFVNCPWTVRAVRAACVTYARFISASAWSVRWFLGLCGDVRGRARFIRDSCVFCARFVRDLCAVFWARIIKLS